MVRIIAIAAALIGLTQAASAQVYGDVRFGTQSAYGYTYNRGSYAPPSRRRDLNPDRLMREAARAMGHPVDPDHFSITATPSEGPMQRTDCMKKSRGRVVGGVLYQDWKCAPQVRDY